jgi:adenylate cyclase
LNDGLARDISERNIFGLFYQNKTLMQADSREELIKFHLSIAKNQYSRTGLLTAAPDMEVSKIDKLGKFYDETDPAPLGSVPHIQGKLAPRSETNAQWFDVHASTFWEGFFIVYLPVNTQDDSLMQLLGRRDIVIRDLMKRRRPYLTHVAVIIVDIQDTVKICDELPPEEYFEFIDYVWGVMEPKLRKFYATHGKHIVDGMVYYFSRNRTATTP